MIIIKAGAEHLDELAPLFDAYRIFYQQHSNVKAGKYFLEERITKNESEIFIAIDDDKRIIGFVQLYPVFSSTRLKKYWLLNDLFVDAASRGKGIAVALIQAVKDLCINSGSCGMMLETAKTNIEGNKLYPKTGFILDENHNYYFWDLPTND